MAEQRGISTVELWARQRAEKLAELTMVSKTAWMNLVHLSVRLSESRVNLSVDRWGST